MKLCAPPNIYSMVMLDGRGLNMETDPCIALVAPRRSKTGAAIRRHLLGAGYEVAAPDVRATSREASVAVIVVGTNPDASLDSLAEITRRGSALRSLVIVEGGGRREARRALELGASALLVAPLTSRELIARTEALLGEAKLVREQLARLEPLGTRSVVDEGELRAKLRLSRGFSPTERRLLPHFLVGRPQKEIAELEAMKPRMVRFHGDNIRRRTGGMSWAEIRACCWPAGDEGRL